MEAMENYNEASESKSTTVGHILVVEAWKILTAPDMESLIEQVIEEDPARLALRLHGNDFPARLVSERVKSLQKARYKLPTFYHSRCFFTLRALEQCSSEAAASLKIVSGDTALDLTCGLGVDTWNFARQMKQVTALEPDPELHAIVRHNFQQMGLSHVEVLNQTAEAFLADFQGPCFDLIYADPDRRPQSGARRHHPDDGSPAIRPLLPKLRTIGRRLLLKLSPMFDLAEAQRLFPEAHTIIVVSVEGECKELLLDIDLSEASGPASSVQLWMARKEGSYHISLPDKPGPAAALPPPGDIRYLAEPDVAAYKAQRLEAFRQAGPWAEEWAVSHPQGFWAAASRPTIAFPGRLLGVEAAFPYKPKALKSWLKARDISRLDITKRNFPFTVEQTRAALRMPAGGDYQLWCTEIKGEAWCFLGKPEAI